MLTFIWQHVHRCRVGVVMASPPRIYSRWFSVQHTHCSCQDGWCQWLHTKICTQWLDLGICVLDNPWSFFGLDTVSYSASPMFKLNRSILSVWPEVQGTQDDLTHWRQQYLMDGEIIMVATASKCFPASHKHHLCLAWAEFHSGVAISQAASGLRKELNVDWCLY